MWVLQGDPRERQEPQLWVQKWGMPSLWCYYHPRFFWHPFHNVWLSISACCPTPFFTSARWALQANDLQGLCISVQGFGLGFGGEVLHGGGLMQSEIPSGLDQDVLWGKADINEIPWSFTCLGAAGVAVIGLQRCNVAHTFGRGSIHFLVWQLTPLAVAISTYCCRCIHFSLWQVRCFGPCGV